MASRETFVRLTPQQWEMLKLGAQGLKNREIDLDLGICTGTVKSYLKHVFEKTSIQDRYGLALVAVGGYCACPQE